VQTSWSLKDVEARVIAGQDRTCAKTDLLKTLRHLTEVLDCATDGRGAVCWSTTRESGKYRRDAPRPKLVCINIQPYGSTQAPGRDNILNIDGFSDAMFNIFSGFLFEDSGRLVAEIEAVELQ